VNNLKQIGLAVFMYADEHKETYNLSYHSSSYGFDNAYFHNILTPYTGDDAVFVCSSDPDLWKNRYGSDLSYVASYKLHPPGTMPSNAALRWVHMAQVKRPSEAVSTAPNADGAAPDGQLTVGTHGRQASSGYSDWARVGRFRHGTLGNYLFADGHVASLTAGEIADEAKYWAEW
jgi:prepilin-type processing-associated H-X9-DG protein